MASTETGVSMTSSAPVMPSHAVGGSIGAGILELHVPRCGPVGSPDRCRASGFTR
jgi:hypothetical protein